MRGRLTELRESLGLNKSQFAQKLGLTHAAISSIELGKNPLTEQNIRLICLTFQVDEAWLRTGAGVMFTDEAPGERELLDTFRKLSPGIRQSIIKITQDLLEAQENAGKDTEKKEAGT
ncbi:MAG: helix-turn-helix domain-containing protein [Spirochaetaceae bacterium]|nr:helix-turn-helix domain-containing protein [Spirochaetaceae bacterium]